MVKVSEKSIVLRLVRFMIYFRWPMASDDDLPTWWHKDLVTAAVYDLNLHNKGKIYATSHAR